MFVCVCLSTRRPTCLLPAYWRRLRFVRVRAAAVLPGGLNRIYTQCCFCFLGGWLRWGWAFPRYWPLTCIVSAFSFRHDGMHALVSIARLGPWPWAPFPSRSASLSLAVFIFFGVDAGRCTCCPRVRSLCEMR